MAKRNIVVIGASAGGFNVLKKLVAGLPPDLDASIFIVWHMAPTGYGILPQVLNNQQTLLATHPTDKEPIKTNHIYVAPPDRHLILEDKHIRVTNGPKENRFRPAVDPLFRSAAHIYGPRVIGVILSGALDDGSAGLWAIKQRGGLAVVQDPTDAEVPSMPENAIRLVEVDYQVPAAEMASLIAKLCTQESEEKKPADMEENEKIKMEIQIAIHGDPSNQSVMKFGDFSPFTCPECHGVLMSFKEGGRIRFRCHTGHAYSADSLLADLTQNIEESYWTTIRSLQESVMLLNHLGDHLAEINQSQLATMYFKKAAEAEERMQLVRKALQSHELLNTDSIRQEAGGTRIEKVN